MTTPTLLPDPLKLCRDYLASSATVTAIVGTRIRVNATDPTWPSLRLTALSSTETTRRRIDRVLLQIDCWCAPGDASVTGSGDAAAQLLARTVRAALVESPNYVGTGAVIAGISGVAMHPAPDTTRTPPTPRWVVTFALYVRPNP
jgi:hypothetical protein